ncbi:MAG: hypothetical protein LH614_09930, partial [Pyrinomonadaceae bacterium]|nr:hypothetical protein [Pyrinomonadaceae bacterium]
FYGEDYSVREIAELVGWTQSNVKTRLFRARNYLRNTPQKLNNPSQKVIFDDWEDDEFYRFRQLISTKKGKSYATNKTGRHLFISSADSIFLQ